MATQTALHADTRIAVLGAGKMGGILLQGFLESGLCQRSQVVATVAHEAKAAELGSRLGIRVTTDNREAVRGAGIVLLGVKPTQIDDLARQVATHISPGALVISIAASVTTAAMEEALSGAGQVAVVRAMPNTPAKVGAGMTVLVRGKFATDEHLALAGQIFATVGRSVVLDEKHMDAATGLSGSGPAFIYIIVEALAEAGVNVGLPRDIATQLAAQTTFGAAKMVLETGAHPALLKDEVTTPAGCTVDGIMELEAGGLRITLLKAVKRAAERARQLAGN